MRRISVERDGEAPEPALDPEVVGKEQPRADKADPRPQVFQEIVASFARSSGPVYHPIFEKFESEHVSQFLRRHMRRIGKSGNFDEASDGFVSATYRSASPFSSS